MLHAWLLATGCARPARVSASAFERVGPAAGSPSDHSLSDVGSEGVEVSDVPRETRVKRQVAVRLTARPRSDMRDNEQIRP